MKIKLTVNRLLIACAILLLGFIASVGYAQDMSDQFLAGKHAKQGLQCNACHGDKMSSEVDYEKTCLGCHKQEDIEKRSEKLVATLGRNPHKGHYPDLACTECHKGHEEDQNFCENCHTH